MIDIQLINNDTQVRFEKRLWHPTELTLAVCYGFHVNLAETDKDSTVITANVNNTFKDAMLEFIKVSFKNFSESISEQSRRDAFFARLDASYQNYENWALNLMREKLPYFEKLYLHQKQGIAFSLMHRVNFLAFEMRLGKSVTAASLSRCLGLRRTAIICPVNAKWEWFHGLTDQNLWGFNELYFTMLDSAKSKSFRALQERFVIANFDILGKFKDNIVSDEVFHFIIDEAHRAKNRFSNRSKIIQEILDVYPNAYITFLSGTPVANRFNDLFNYFKMAHHPLGESYKKFTDEYTIQTASRGGTKITGAKNVDDLKRKMLNFMMVRKMSDCFDMPENIISRYTFDLDDYRDEYNAIIEEMAKEKNMAALRGHLHSINIITVKAKMKGIIEIIEEVVAAEGKVVVFGSYKEPFRILQEHFGSRCVLVDGSVNGFDRNKAKREFWDNPDVPIFLGNYLAAGEALDLSVCSDILHLNFPFTPRELRQAQARCQHPEKKMPIRYHYTFAKESIDEHIYENMILSKERDINLLMTDGDQVVDMESIEEILIKKLLNKDNLDGITYDFGSKNSEKEKSSAAGNSEATRKPEVFPDMVSGIQEHTDKFTKSSEEEGEIEAADKSRAEDNENSSTESEVGVHGEMHRHEPLLSCSLEYLEESGTEKETGGNIPSFEEPKFIEQPNTQIENDSSEKLGDETAESASDVRCLQGDGNSSGNIKGSAFGISRKTEAVAPHPEYPAKGYDSTGGFPKNDTGTNYKGVRKDGTTERKLRQENSVTPSFEAMAEMVKKVEDNKDQFIPYVNDFAETGQYYQSERKPNITQEEINKNMEHVIKTREEIQSRAKKTSVDSVPPPPTFL